VARSQFLFIRCSTSSYMSNHFFRQEQSTVESLGGQWQLLDSATESLKKILSQATIPVVLLTNTHTRFTPAEWALIHQHAALVLHPNSGRDNFPEEELQRLTIPLLSGHSIRAGAVAEFILSHLFYLHSSPPMQKKWHPERVWNRPLLAHQHGLIIGLGHIGSRLKAVLQALGTTLSFFDPEALAPNNDPAILKKQNTYDFMILAAELNASTMRMINSSFLSQQKNHLLLINAARGEMVNLPDLLSFLEQNPKARAVLDVFPEEPYPFEKHLHLIEGGQLYCSSHQAGCFDQLLQNMLHFTEQNLKEWLENPHAFSAGVHRL
jgi:phosphoglycerate dehydrogenase-like enzyme